MSRMVPRNITMVRIGLGLRRTVCVFFFFYSWTARESFVILLVDRPMFVPHDSKPDHFLLESFLARDRSMLEINHIHCNQSLFKDSIEYIE